ncbi:hypothetical protein PPYR_09727 [Photinus pyralis]|uniref:Peptidase S1 domain-containing protein n=1 Tax=Photinus pyralis TaxID=7054 RepID=A0A5N4AEB9_PHOPY|nr:chymotrypsin-2-like [Photinus pyralis]XP_031348256.1 chymotrypsin-2-like [Photinus pyralis]XP_031348257.1 chymotrypsin-2-like [Photinus pyralis]XP_031348258.1 chymotrypsin-2-like [Photinus pyralis]KAB0795666.1 hypothetical protein PPYR_09727 [Photinus pyralis]
MKIISFVVQIVLCVLPLDGAPSEKVLGGTLADISSCPYQVSLRSKSNQHFCGGSIIGEQWILTAAHCLTGQSAPSIMVIVGTVTLNAGGSRYGVLEIISHPSYNTKTHANDIALLRVSSKIVFGPTVKSVTLSADRPPAGMVLTLTGWGLTRYPSDTIPNSLQTVQLTAISIAQCKASLSGHSISDNHVCTSGGVGKGACQGDSGGPLVYNNLQVGVVSWGIPCAKGYPDVFTAIASYVAWIQQSTTGRSEAM